jgi:hypothetical protein
VPRLPMLVQVRVRVRVPVLVRVRERVPVGGTGRSTTRQQRGDIWVTATCRQTSRR